MWEIPLKPVKVSLWKIEVNKFWKKKITQYLTLYHSKFSCNTKFLEVSKPKPNIFLIKLFYFHTTIFLLCRLLLKYKTCMYPCATSSPLFSALYCITMQNKYGGTQCVSMSPRRSCVYIYFSVSVLYLRRSYLQIRPSKVFRTCWFLLSRLKLFNLILNVSKLPTEGACSSYHVNLWPSEIYARNSTGRVFVLFFVFHQFVFS